jgi:hypothetical protein
MLLKKLLPSDASTLINDQGITVFSLLDGVRILSMSVHGVFSLSL